MCNLPYTLFTQSIHQNIEVVFKKGSIKITLLNVIRVKLATKKKDLSYYWERL